MLRIFLILSIIYFYKDSTKAQYLEQGKQAIIHQSYDSAVFYFSKELSNSPNSKEALIGRAGAYYWLQQFDEAINDYDALILQYPRFADAYYRRGFIKMEQSNTKDACKDWKKSLKLKQNPKVEELLIKKCR